MRLFLLTLAVIAGTLSAQTRASIQPAVSATATQAALTNALLGHWTGVLEYRDYSEPATSPKRVQLPTWLHIGTQPEGLRFEYTYDDGPSKVVFSNDTVVVDTGARTYRVMGTDNLAESYTMTGVETLKDGRGTLMLTGTGKDNDQLAEIRTTWTIRRNLLSWLEEVRPAGSTEPFTFRHRYTFTRAETPAPPIPRK